MASFSISPDRMTLTLLFFAFFHYIFFLPPSLSPFVFDSGFLYNLIDSTDKKLWIRTINSHVRIIHQGYRSHVRRDFIEIWNFVFQRSFQVLSFLLKFHRRITFFFFFGKNGSRLISSVQHFLSLRINRVWKKGRKLKIQRDKGKVTKVREKKLI